MIASFIFRPLDVDYLCVGRKFLLFNMVARNLKIKYRRSILGVLWTLALPICTAAIYYFVFHVVMKVHVPNYIITLLAGVLPWAFFSQTIAESVSSIVDQNGLITKIPLPVQVFPLTATVTNIITFTFSIPIIFLAALLSNTPLTFHFLWIFYFSVLLFFLAYALSTLCAIAYAYLRDLKHVVTLTLQIWMYATPIFYREQMIPEKYRGLFYFNPVAPVFAGIHQAIIDGTMPNVVNLLVPVAWLVILSLASITVLKMVAPTVVEKL